MPFVHLHVHSAFSFLFGTFLPEALVEAASRLSMPAVALTDKNGLYGAIRFYKAAQKKNIHPVIGAEITLEDQTSLILLASSDRGYGNLCKIITHAHSSAPRGSPASSLQSLAERSKGLIVLTGGREGLLWKLFASGREREGRSFANRLVNIFGMENLFVEIQSHISSDQKIISGLCALAHDLNLPVVATNGVCFLEKKGYRVHNILVGIQRTVHHREVEPVPNEHFYFKSYEEMASAISYPEALENTLAIARRCQLNLKLGKFRPPSFSLANAHEKLTRICFKSLARRYKPAPRKALFNLQHELDVLKERGLAEYFLFVKEIRDCAGEKGIRCTVRGSAAGSFVTYLLLGGVDPLKNGLLLERFMNEHRQDMPDIDLDFDSDRRDEVTEYIIEKYGTDRVALVATIPTFRARSAIREIGRALGYSYEKIKRLAAFVPYYLGGSQIEAGLESLPELKGSELKKEREIIELASACDGLPRHLSVHLGGVAIAGDRPLTSLVPVEMSAKGFPVCQLDKDDIEALGLVKLDLLGLRMHTAISKTLACLKAREVDLDLDRIPLHDCKTFKLLRTMDTVGVFQVESPGQRQLLGRLQPREFSDIIAEISLFRPGPMHADMIAPFIKRRRGQEAVAYFHPCLEPVLKETYGVIVFQEQVLRIAHELAGFTYGEADSLRRAMTKDRSPEEMQNLQDWFIEGCVRNGVAEEVAKKVFSKIAAFAAFGFCKAHAASFAHITYQSAYLKTHHPLEFYTGLLNAGQVGSYPKSVIVNEARRKGFPTLPPHVNFSQAEFTIENGAIRVGLSMIRGIGLRFTERILDARKKGPFRCLEDFHFRVSLPSSAHSALENAGALEGLSEVRCATSFAS
jgi:DNA-directed DNA polymerase III PolC